MSGVLSPVRGSHLAEWQDAASALAVSYIVPGMSRRLPVCLLVALAAALGSSPASPAEFAVVTADERLASAVREGGFFRWMSRQGGAPVAVGPEARGERVVAVARWPVAADFAPLLAGLPLSGDGARLVFGGSSYPAERVVLAVRRPRRGEGEAEWVVVGQDEGGLSEAVTQVLAWIVLGRDAPPDYLLREGRWLERKGTWAADGDAVRAVDERDDFAARERWRAGLEPAGGAAVRLLAPPSGAGPAPEIAALASSLDAFARSALARLPLALDEPVTLAVEPDLESQGRHTGRIGPAVPGTVADLHLVVHPDDEWAYRHAVAGELVERWQAAGPGRPRLPLWLERGAALWLSEAWYGRAYREWLPALAAAGAFPDAARLLAREPSPAESEPLWTPVAAAVIDRLPGTTLAEKLARLPTAAAVESLLAQVATAAARAAGELPVPPAPPRPAPAFLRGVSLAMHNSLDGGYHARSVDATLDRLAALGADAVSLMPFAYQPDPRRPGLRFLNDSPASETDVGVVHAARRAHAKGFRVLWKPHLWIAWESWPGDVEMTTEADWQAWFAEYRTYVLHHAFLAAWAGADLFSVGVELVKTLPREAEWRRLVADVRRLYPGAVTYSANWSGGVEGVGFWDALDYVGVDAYWPLGGEEATVEEMIVGARAVAGRLAELASTAERPLLLTEVGFAARRGAWVEPHTEGGELSEEHQARAYRALVAAFGRRPQWLAGVFVWKAFSGGPERTDRADFRFLGREAEGVVGEWFRPLTPAGR